jgi:uncharacterized protein YodC (DUF2158 family)
MTDGLKAGDVVQLNSGGPDMTVARFEEINGVTSAVCGWFIGKKQQIVTFPVTMLKRVE